eukprot:g1374.t1
MSSMMDTRGRIRNAICDRIHSAAKETEVNAEHTRKKWNNLVAECQGDVVVELNGLKKQEAELSERFQILIEKALYETDRRSTAKEFARDVINYVVGRGKEIVHEHNTKIGKHLCRSLSEMSDHIGRLTSDIQKSVVESVDSECEVLISRGWDRAKNVRSSYEDEIRTSRAVAERRLTNVKSAHVAELEERTEKLRKNFDSQVAAIQSSLETQLRQRTDELKGVTLELDAVKRSRTTLQGEMKATRERMLRTVQQREAQNRILRSENGTLRSQIDTLQDQIASAGRDLEEVEGRWGGIERRLKEMEKELVARDRKIKAMHKDVENARVDANSLRSASREIHMEVLELRKSKSSAKSEIDKLTKKVTKQSKQIVRLEKSAATSRGALDEVERKLTVASNELSVLKKKHDILTADKFRVENESRVSKERVATLQLKLFRTYHHNNKKKSNGASSGGHTVTKKNGGVFGLTKMLKASRPTGKAVSKITVDGNDDDVGKGERASTAATSTATPPSGESKLPVGVSSLVRPSKVALPADKNAASLAAPSTKEISSLKQKVGSLEAKLAASEIREKNAREEHLLMSREKDLLLSQLTILLRQYKARLQETSIDAATKRKLAPSGAVHGAAIRPEETHGDSGSSSVKPVSAISRGIVIGPVGVRELVKSTFSSEVKAADADVFATGTFDRWQYLGICGMCSVKLRCCGATKFGVTNGTLQSHHYAIDRVNCTIDDGFMRMSDKDRQDTVDFCSNWCKYCYQNPDLEDMSFFAASSFKNDGYAFAYLWVVCFTFVFSVCLILIQRLGRTTKIRCFRRWMILPIFQPYLRIYAVLEFALIVVLVSTDTDSIGRLSDRVCCTQAQAFRLLFVVLWTNLELLLPLLILVQRTFTPNAIGWSFLHALTLSAIVPIALFISQTTAVFDGDYADADFIYDEGAEIVDQAREDLKTRVLGLTWTIVAYGCFLIFWVLLNVCSAQRAQLRSICCYWCCCCSTNLETNGIQSKRYFWYYALPFFCYSIISVAARGVPDVILTTTLFWHAVRIPILYLCLVFESRFWTQSSDTTDALSNDVIREVQQFLHDRKDILLDYLDITLDEKIGEGATAIVYRGRYGKKDVAVKVYTPKTITPALLSEFAEEVDVMRKLRHDNIASITGIAIMPPNIVVVLPLYDGGSLKSYLNEARQKMQTSRRSLHGGDDDDDDSATKRMTAPLLTSVVVDATAAAEKENEDNAFFVDSEADDDDATWGRRYEMALELCSSIRYIHSRTPTLMHRDLKPANILMNAKGRLILSDFGESTTSENAHLPKERMRMTKSYRFHFVMKACGCCSQRCAKFLRVLWVVCGLFIVAVGLSSTVGLSSSGRGVSSFTFLLAGLYLVFSLVFVWIMIGAACCIGNTCAVPQAICLRCLEIKPKGVLARTIRGSPLWMAPEIIRGRFGLANYGPEADIYSLSIVLWQILSLQSLYPGIRRAEVFEGVENGTLRPPIPSSWPKDLASLICDGWEHDPKKRPSAREMYDRLLACREGSSSRDSPTSSPVLQQ